MELRRIEKAHYQIRSEKCPTCSHEEFEQWHKLSEPHVKALIKLAEAVRHYGRPVRRYEAGIGKDGSEYGNFAAMRWWRLINSPRKTHWTVSPLGWDFLANRRGVPTHILTLKGEYIGESIGLVGLRQIADQEAWEKADYIANRLPHIEPGALVS
jgi:hypothetical protein